jgi:exodeoxyribonuclease VII large subunit
VGRGGGSKEDLSVFNDEEVAMAIWNMETPVISAVGHEIDTSITDFIADASAPTPTAASDMAVFSYEDFLNDIEDYKIRMNNCIIKKIEAVNNRIDVNKLKLEKLSPKGKIEIFKKNLAHNRQLIKEKMLAIIEKDKSRLKVLSSKIDGLSPLKRIYEGYSYITNENEKNVKSIKDVKIGENIKARVSDGYIESTVNKASKVK